MARKRGMQSNEARLTGSDWSKQQLCRTLKGFEIWSKQLCELLSGYKMAKIVVPLLCLPSFGVCMKFLTQTRCNLPMNFFFLHFFFQFNVLFSWILLHLKLKHKSYIPFDQIYLISFPSFLLQFLCDFFFLIQFFIFIFLNFILFLNFTILY